MVKRLLLLVALWMLAASSFALVPAGSGWRMSFSGATVYSSEIEGCNAFLAKHKADNPTHSSWTVQKIGTSPNSVCYLFANGNAQNGDNLVFVTNVCPANSSAVTGGCQCAAGYNESGGQCIQNQCGADTGKVGLITWTEGYTATPDEGDTKAVGGSYNPPPSSGSICQSGCQVSAQLAGPGVEFYVSQQPTSQGLYRRSRIMPTVGLGTPCTASDQAANSPTAAEPQCPGTVGLVGNKVTCVSTPAKPVASTDMGTPPVPPLAGNPAAGAVPSTGAGSTPGSAGRTPDAGTGGNAGGGANAAVGGRGGSGTGAGTGSGTGTGTGTNTNGRVVNPGNGTEQANCGAPGQPVCSVKVDENGTPQVGDTFKTANDATDKAKTDSDTLRDKVAGKDDKGFFQPFKDLFLTPPMAACEAIALPDRIGMSIDPCPVVDGVRGVMAWIWAAGGLWLCFGMIKRTI